MSRRSFVAALALGAGVALAAHPVPTSADPVEPRVKAYSTMTTSPAPHPGLKVTNSSGTAPRTVCSAWVLKSADVPDGAVIDVQAMVQYGHNYTPYYMVAGYLRANGVTISRAHGTNFNKTIHHLPMNYFGHFAVTAENRSKWFDSAGELRIEQVSYAAGPLWSGGVEPAPGTVVKVEYVQLNVKVLAP